jgi:hypothetical protein
MTNLTPSAGGKPRLWLVCGELVTFTLEQVRGNPKNIGTCNGEDHDQDRRAALARMTKYLVAIMLGLASFAPFARHKS